MKSFGMVAGGLAAVGLAVVAFMYVKAHGGALGGLQPGARPEGVRPLNAQAQYAPQQPPQYGYAPPPGSSTAGDFQAWAGVFKQGLGILDQLYSTDDGGSAIQ